MSTREPSYVRRFFRAALEMAYYAALFCAFTALLIGLVIAGAGEGAGVAWLIFSVASAAVALPLHFVIVRVCAPTSREGETFVPSPDQDAP